MAYEYAKGVECEWVAGFWEREDAITIKGLVKENVGYYKLEDGKGWIKAAFRRPADSATPEHLVVISDSNQIAKLERRRLRLPEPRKVYHHKPTPALKLVNDFNDRIKEISKSND